MIKTNNTGKSTWSNNKIILQNYYTAIDFDDSEEDIIQLWQKDGSESNLIIIEKSCAREVALTICPEIKKEHDLQIDDLKCLINIGQETAIEHGKIIEELRNKIKILETITG